MSEQHTSLKQHKRLYFLAPDDVALPRKHFRSENNLDWLLTYLCRGVRDRLFRAFPPRAATDEVARAVQKIGETQTRAVLDKLRRQHPRDSERDDSTLLRWYPDRAGALVNQAMLSLEKLWIEDLAAHPKQALQTRCQRLLPRLGSLDNRNGKSATSDYARLWFLVTYENAKHALGHLPRPPRSVKVILDAFDDLSAVTPSELQTHTLLHPVTGQLFFNASDEELEKWCHLSRHEIACEIAVKAVHGLSLGADTLHRMLPGLRLLARTVNRAIPQ